MNNICNQIVIPVYIYLVDACIYTLDIVLQVQLKRTRMCELITTYHTFRTYEDYLSLMEAQVWLQCV